MIGRDTTELSISREAFLNVGAKVIQAVLGFAGVIILTRMLGSEGLGRYRTVLAAAFFILTLSEDIAAVIRKRVAEVDTNPPEFLVLGLVVHCGVTIVTILGLFIARSAAVSYFGSAELTTGVAIVTASVGFFSVLNYYQAGIGYPARETWFDSLRSVFTLGAQVALLILGFQAFGALVGLAVASLVSGVFVWLSIRHKLVVPTARTAQRTYDYARHSLPSSIANNLYQRADPLLIRSFSGAGDVGFYALASQLTMPGTLFASSITSVLSVKSSGVSSVDGEVRRDLINSTTYIGLVSVPILFGVLSISNSIMQSNLFGTTYRNAPGLVLVGMGTIRVLDGFKKPFSAAVNGIDRPDINLRVKLFTLLVYAPIAIGLGQVYGLFGVVAATVIAEGVALISYQFVATRLFDGIVFPKPVGHQFLAGGVMFAAVEGLSRVMDLSQLAVLGFVIGVGAIVYFATLLLVSQHFRKTLVRTLNDFN
ncbi:oligosaccharide flippase family protein [Natrinema halophilum]|uniref:Oligosaccharide flippase family protein n=1 Tax=Natrinema halophilum TaxID=1699371 RepID=A0A7D5H285_9EURY|nr:oligosaccharide flippase family protein [Natrinema halophilum]QLG48891.1 oligosaccharide flippase family protein [Natrinema halophilum]